MDRVRLILVGGFLGAGKTTLLAEVAARLMDQGKRVGLVTNDQASDLVDTGLLARRGIAIKEVAGGCFCCRFEELETAASELVDELKPDVLLGEPVGSCTDISATVLQPIKWLWTDWISIAPFSVLVDPRRLRQVLGNAADAGFPESVFYIYRKQLEEADMIVINKADLLSSSELDELARSVADAYPETEVLSMSAATGEGVDGWLARVLEGDTAGRRVVEVDYDTYAEGEAVLGWLNAAVRLEASGEICWSEFARDLIGRMQATLQYRQAEIAHLKLLLTAESGAVVANVTSLTEEPSLRGEIAGTPVEAALVVNARVHSDPEALRQVVEEALAAACGLTVTYQVDSMQNFSPAYPTPVHRYESVVQPDHTERAG